MKKLLLLALAGFALYSSPIGRSLPGRRGMQTATAAEAAAIVADSKKPTVVLLYATLCPITNQMFGDFSAFAKRAEAAGAEVLAFSTDAASDTRLIRPFLAHYGSTVRPRWIEKWRPGQLDAAFRPLGIHIGQTYTRPLLAVKAADGRILYQAQAARDVAAAERALTRALSR